jgi:hypothetical protein
MSTTQPPQNTPLADPRVEADPEDRDMTASWPVGPPAKSGEQKRATLKVLYHKGTGYTAILATMHETIMEYGVSTRLNLSFDRHEVTICTSEATRFSRKVLGEVYTIALAKLRGRYESGDDAVSTYFDPNSPVFDYA